MSDNPTILFISHKQSDSKEQFDKLYQHLRTHYDDDEIYIDVDSNQPGRPWKESQQAALEACACMLVVVGKDWTPGKWIAHELATAFEREIPVIPVGVGDKPNFLEAEALEGLIRTGLEQLLPPYTHDPAIVDEIKHLFDLQAEMVTAVSDIAQLEKLDRLIWSQALMPPCKGKLPAGYHLPFPRNQVFTGRKQDLLSLAKLAMEKNPATMLVTQLVEGMGGIGKTQLAIEFCYRYGRFFKGVHWLNLRDPNAFMEQMAENGRVMFGDQVANMELPDLVRLTLAQWEQAGSRLIVFDNLEEEKAYVEISQRLENCDARIILTARNSHWGAGVISPKNRLPLGCFTREDSLDFLHEVLDEKYSAEQLDALAQRMGDLPLALELASAYLGMQKLGTIKDYFAKLDQQSLEHRSLNLIGKQTGYTEHDLNLTKTFLVSFEALTDENAQFLFKSSAFIAPNQPFPAVIFQHFFEGDELEEILNDALHAVESASLVEVNDGWLTIHPLLAEFGQRLEGARTALEKLADVLARTATQLNEYGEPRRVESLYPHLLSTARHTEALGLEISGSLWTNTGFYLDSVASYEEARNHYQHSLKLKEEYYKKDNPSIATTVNNLGMVLQALGDYAGAKAAYERALRIDEAAFGPDHPKVAIRVNNLGGVLEDMGDYAGAKAAYERALRIDEAAFGSDHPEVATDVNNLGAVLEDMGDYAGAKAAYERALRIWEESLGTEHPNVASAVNNLGGVLQEMGDYAGAKAAYQRALRIDEAAFGPDHPNVARDVNNLGGVLREMGDYAGAKEQFERALRIDEAAYGPDHPNVAIRVWNLGALLLQQGQAKEAVPNLQRALAIFEKTLPAGHPNIDNVKTWLAAAQQKSAENEDLDV